MKFLLAGAAPKSIINFRGVLVKAIADKGWKVTTLAAAQDPDISARVRELGAVHRKYSVARTGVNPFQDLATLNQFRNILKEEKPDKILAYTVKPVTWLGIANRFFGKAEFYALITGLGYVFHGNSLKRKVIRWFVTRLYKLSLSGAKTCFFQNVDNLEAFVQYGIVDREKCVVVNGSGVDLEHYKHTPQPQSDNGVRFLLIARLLGDKGIREYAAAASRLKSEYSDTSFVLVGPTDPSPDGIKLSEVQSWVDSDVLEYAGNSDDVREHLSGASVYVLPSYHEGTPRTVLEAMAMGRAVITTDAPGCRETVIPNENGFLVEPKSVDSLYQAMKQFVEQPELIEKFGSRSREIAEDKYDVHKVNAVMLKEMGIS